MSFVSTLRYDVEITVPERGYVKLIPHWYVPSLDITFNFTHEAVFRPDPPIDAWRGFSQTDKRNRRKGPDLTAEEAAMLTALIEAEEKLAAQRATLTELVGRLKQ